MGWVDISYEQHLFCQGHPMTLEYIALCHNQSAACKNNSLEACDACYKSCQFAGSWMDDEGPMYAIRDYCGDMRRALCAKPSI